MNESLTKIVKIICVIISIILISVLCWLLLRFDKANLEEKNTPIFIHKNYKKQQIQTESQQPLTRDENDIPKSDYKVPEIG